ncbi:MAG TPA: hypothetical protein V6C95_04755 [Coleofasciculaceae cyanobacterium]
MVSLSGLDFGFTTLPPKLAPEIQRQSYEFADLPDVMPAMQQQWNKRWQELSQAIT